MEGNGAEAPESLLSLSQAPIDQTSTVPFAVNPLDGIIPSLRSPVDLRTGTDILPVDVAADGVSNHDEGEDLQKGLSHPQSSGSPDALKDSSPVSPNNEHDSPRIDGVAGNSLLLLSPHLFAAVQAATEAVSPSADVEHGSFSSPHATPPPKQPNPTGKSSTAAKVGMSLQMCGLVSICSQSCLEPTTASAGKCQWRHPRGIYRSTSWEERGYTCFFLVQS